MLYYATYYDNGILRDFTRLREADVLEIFRIVPKKSQLIICLHYLYMLPTHCL
jgi:hypothetical protein